MSGDMPAGLPPVVLIGPHRWTVTIDRSRMQDHDWSYGVTFKARQEIALSPDQSPSQLRETVLHEVLHACLEMQGVACGGDKALLTDDEEERLVRGLSPILLDVLRRNPDLVDWLTHIAADGG